MREGKISQAVLERSVIRTIRSKNENVIKGAQIGSDFSFVSVKEADIVALAARTITMKDLADLKFGFYHLLNHAACANCVLTGVVTSVLFPEKEQEDLLKSLMKLLDEMCAEFGIQILGGHTSVSKDIDFPIVSLTCMGLSQTSGNIKVVPGQDIVIINHVGIEGTLRAVSKYRDKLLEKLPMHVLNETERYVLELSAVKEALLAYEAGASVVHTAGEGGIFAGLWEFAFEGKVGIEIDLKKIPIHQETVEICEILEVNPYEFMSTGTLIAAVDNGERLCRIFEQNGMKAVVCGRTNSSNDRVIINEDENRYLVPAMQDCIYKI